METQERYNMLKAFDPEVAELLKNEENKQRNSIGLIASENVASPLSICLEEAYLQIKIRRDIPENVMLGEQRMRIELRCLQ